MNVIHRVFRRYVRGMFKDKWYTVIKVPEFVSERTLKLFLDNLGVEYAEIRGRTIIIPHYIKESMVIKAYRKTLRQIGAEEYDEFK